MELAALLRVFVGRITNWSCLRRRLGYFQVPMKKTSVSQGIPGLERKIYKIQGISDFAGDVWQVILLLSQLSEALFGNYRQKWG